MADNRVQYVEMLKALEREIEARNPLSPELARRLAACETEAEIEAFANEICGLTVAAGLGVIEMYDDALRRLSKL